MRVSTKSFVVIVVVIAAAATGGLFVLQPLQPQGGANALLVLSILAFVAEMLALALPRTAKGSVAYVAYLAMVLVVPTWAGVAAVAAVKIIMEVLQRKPALQVAFNAANHGLSQALATFVYVGLGGQTFLIVSRGGIADLTLSVGVSGVLACLVAIGTNTILLSTVIALANRSSFLTVWRDNHENTIGLNLLCTTLVFVFAWVYVAYGWIVAVVLWIPILGIRQVSKTNLELEQAHQELLQLMVKSIEARDPYTSGHSRRVSRFSILIARAVGLKDRQVERIGVAALLHDVGKIHEKYAPILSKPDRLTADEWATMQEHPIDGANLVATISRLSDIVPAVRHHHENWDGTGYPDGLAGERIPLASRIIMFADTIDAMTTDRPYRRPLDANAVRMEIVRCSGKQFDPELAEQLLSSPVWATLLSGTTATPNAKNLVLVRGKVRGTA